MAKVFITGGTGFVGRHVINLLANRGHYIQALRRPGPFTGPAMDGVLWLERSLDMVPVEELRGSDVLIHLAAHGVIGGNDDWDHCFQVNVTQSLALWRRAVEAGVPRFVIAGSCFEYGKSADRYLNVPVTAPLEPISAYQASKGAATLAAHALAVEYRRELVVLRPFHVYGDGEHERRLWQSLRKAASSGKDLAMTGGEQIRDFVPVEKVASTFVDWATGVHPLLAGCPLIKNVGTGEPTSVRSFAEHWWRRFGATGSLHFGSVPYRKNEVMRYVAGDLDEAGND